MKSGKVLRILAVILLIFSVMPAVPFAVHAADGDPTGTIIGWRQFSWPEDEIDEIGIESVVLTKNGDNSEELPENGGSLTFVAGDFISCKVTFKQGYKLGGYVDVQTFLTDAEKYVEDSIYLENVANYNYAYDYFGTMNKGIDPGFEDGLKAYVVIPVTKMTDEELEHVIDSVDLTIKAPEAGTKITVLPDEENPLYLDYDTQDPYPDVTIPSDVHYHLYDNPGELYGNYFEPEIPDPFDRYDLNIYMSNDEHPELKDGDKLLAEIWLIPEYDDESEYQYVFSDNVKVNVSGGTYVLSQFNDGYLTVYIMVTVGGEPVPETGDNSATALWTAMSVLSVCTLACLTFFRKKNRAN